MSTQSNENDTTFTEGIMEDDETEDFLKVETSGCLGLLEGVPLNVKLLFMILISLLSIVCLAIWLNVNLSFAVKDATTDLEYSTRYYTIVANYLGALQDEQQAAITYLLSNRTSDFSDTIADTKVKQIEYNTFIAQQGSSYAATIQQVISSVEKTTISLEEQRDKIQNKSTSAVQAWSQYVSLMDKLLLLFFKLVTVRTVEPEILSYTLFLNVYHCFANSKSLGTIVFSNKALVENSEKLFVSIIAQRRSLSATWSAAASEENHEAFDAIVDSSKMSTMENMERVALTSGAKQWNISVSDWNSNTTAILSSLSDIASDLTKDVTKDSVNRLRQSVGQISGSIAVSFLLFIISVAAGFLFSRTIVGPWRRLNMLQELTIRKFVPKPFLALLQCNRITDVTVGKLVSKEMTLVLVKLIRDNDEDAESSSTMAKRVAWINNSLLCVAPALRHYKGFIEKCTENGFVALFNDCNHAIKFCYLAQKWLREQRSKSQDCNSTLFEPSFAVHSGQLQLAMVGEAERVQATIVSYHGMYVSTWLYFY